MLSESAVRRLAKRQGDPAVVSLYLDVDGRRYPRPSDYAPHLDHLVRVARDLMGGRGRGAEAIEADLARIVESVAGGLDRSSTKGVAFFSASAQGLFETFALPVPVRDQVAVEPHADVAQLVAVLRATFSTLVVAVDHQGSRIAFVGPDGVVEETDAPVDELERRVDTDAEVANLEHRHEEHVRQHFRRVARVTANEFRRRGETQLVLGGAHEATVQFESYLPKDVASAVVGRTTLAPGHPIGELAAAARLVVEDARRERRMLLVKETTDRADQGVGAVAGLPATLEALNNGQIATLVVDPCFVAPGAKCETCGALRTGGGSCARCGGATVAVTNVVDEVVREAFLNHVALEVCADGELDELAHVGALIRSSRPSSSGG